MADTGVGPGRLRIAVLMAGEAVGARKNRGVALLKGFHGDIA